MGAARKQALKHLKCQVILARVYVVYFDLCCHFPKGFFMRHLVLFLVVFVFNAAFFSAHAQSDLAQSDLHEKFGSLPAQENYQISPDGGAIAAILHTDGDNILAIFDLADKSRNTAVKLSHGDIRDMFWASNDQVVVDISITETVKAGQQNTFEVSRFITISRDGKSTGQLMSKGGFGNYAGNGYILSRLANDPDYVLIQFWTNAYKAHLKNGSVKVAAKGLISGDKGSGNARISSESETEYFVAGPDGEIRMRVDYHDAANKRKYLYREAGEKRFKALSSSKAEDGDGATMIIAGFDKQGPVVRSRNKGDKIGLYALSVSDGSLSTLVTSEKYDVKGAIIDPYRDLVIGADIVDDLPRQKFTNNAFKGLQAQLQDIFPGENVRISSWSQDRKKFLLETSKSGVPTKYYLLDVGAGKTSFLGDSYPNIDAASLGQVEAFDYVASDGLEIPGYITYPANGSRKNLPLIVMPHGGPKGVRDSMAFDWWAQYYAAKGYAVYQPNFRGSGGYGSRLEFAALQEWGKKMQSDIYEGVDKLVADGIVDPSRKCIVGASYGGYAALASAAFKPEMFQCVVSVAGVSNVAMQMAWAGDRSGGRDSESVEYWERLIGKRVADGDYIRAISPVFAAQNISAPVLLVHGEGDTVVPISQSKKMAEALERADKDYSFVKLEGEDHWLSAAKTRTELLQATGAFIDAHIGK
jgi:dipeptidyl aminopeptidase/acylaminoacyl peptidase